MLRIYKETGVLGGPRRSSEVLRGRGGPVGHPGEQKRCQTMTSWKNPEEFQLKFTGYQSAIQRALEPMHQDDWRRHRELPRKSYFEFY